MGGCSKHGKFVVKCFHALMTHFSGDGCDLASTLCRYDLRKGNLFVGQWCDELGDKVSLQSC